MSTLGERIKYVRDGILKVNQSAFAEMLGFSRVATISDYEKNKRNPDISTLCKMADIGVISVEWLLTGKGSVSVPASPKHAKSAGSDMESGKPLYCEECATIEVYGINNSGSPKEFPKGEPVGSICVSKKDMAKGIVALKVEGDGMTPTIIAGATAGIDTTDRHLISGKLYAVWFNYEGVTIKRIFVYPDRIVVKPDNAGFPDTTIPTANIGENFIIGRVKWVYQSY
ncbi:MAG: XRE family transcriptional regulator [Thermodesulfobacteriota bacterium]